MYDLLGGLYVYIGNTSSGEGLSMDDSVLRGMAKWPDVPAVFGWLQLDRRGCWRLKGQRIDNAKLVGFINRNYICDRQGRYYFQNGPQQVFVELDLAPYVLFPSDNAGWLTHTGQAIENVEYAWVDEEGNMGMMCDHGLGLIHDQAILHASSLLCDRTGQALGEAALEKALSLFTEGGQDDQVCMRFGTALVNIRSIPKLDLESWGQFVRNPEAD